MNWWETLFVSGLPQVRPMGEVSAVAGEALVISCPVAGYPIYTIKWFRGRNHDIL